MPYGTVKVDNITFDNGGADQTVTVSGLYRATTSGVTVTGTISGQRVEAVSGVITNISGTNATFNSALIPTANIVSGVFASGTASNPSITFTGDLNTGFYAPAIDQIGITTAGGERIRIQEDGDVGIGTNSPEAKLHVLENASTPGVFIRQTGAGSALTVSGSSAFSGVVTATGTITAASFIPTSTGIPTNGIYLPAANTVGIATNSSLAMLLDSSNRLVKGHTESLNTVNFGGSTLTPGIQQHAVDQSNVSIGLTNWQNSATAAHLVLGKARSGVVGTHAVLPANDIAGVINFAGSDGTTFGSLAHIRVDADALTSAGSTPGRMTFSTSAPGSTSPTERMRIRSDGNIGIGGSGSAIVTLYNQGPITGGVSAYANLTASTIQSDVTTNGFVNSTTVGTAAAAFTLSNLFHYSANQGVIGAGSAVTQQYGFNASSSLVGATNNYGFYGNIPSGTGRWNFYANGTASNYFNGSVGIGSGATAPSQLLEIRGSSGGTSPTAAIRLWDSFSGTWTAGADSSDIEFYVADANGPGAMVRSKIANTVEDTTGAGMALTFATTGNTGGSALTERMRIASDGNIGIGTTSITERLTVSGNILSSGSFITSSTTGSLLSSVATGYVGLSGGTSVNLGGNILLYGNSHPTNPSRIIIRQGTSNKIVIWDSTGNISINSSSDTGDQLYILGTLRTSDQIKTYSGDTVAAPGFTWAGDENTGMFRNAIDSLAFSAGGTEIFRVNANGTSGRRQIYFPGTCEVWSSNTLFLEGVTDVRSVTAAGTTTTSAANVFINSTSGLLQRSTSSIKYKTNVEDAQLELSEALVYNSRPVWYRSTCPNDNPDHSHWGFIAEEVAEIDPRMIHWGGDDGTEPEGVQYERYVVHLVKIAQEQKALLDQLQARIEALESGN